MTSCCPPPVGTSIAGARHRPANYKVSTFQNFTWVTDAHYATIPKGVSADKQAAVLNLLAFILSPQQQAKAYDKGFFYPGPAIKGVTLAMAPARASG